MNGAGWKPLSPGHDRRGESMAWFDRLCQTDPSAADYPDTTYFIESPNHRPRAGGTGDIDQVVIHITGGPAMTETSAINRFLSAGASAHYIVNRAGRIYQCVRDDRVANHIRNYGYSVARRSIGIEHVNPWMRGNQCRPTYVQYEMSNCLVRWLSNRYGIPLIHTVNAHQPGIKGHMEADPHTGHQACPNPAWDWDFYMQMLTRST
jgi:N-acetylmuramoyl-L-alanine amidase